jgi:putative FmdB family regulatory protein|tara:strand:- start:418 stop:675 length:258 start_codon:yes stop_codon:yes gene_type:complete
MPKYYYHCNNCHGDFFVYHLMSEVQEECILCSLTDVSKLLTKPLFFDIKNQKSKTGEITKQYIEDNKKILDDMKKQAKTDDYDKT